MPNAYSTKLLLFMVLFIEEFVLRMCGGVGGEDSVQIEIRQNACFILVLSDWFPRQWGFFTPGGSFLCCGGNLIPACQVCSLEGDRVPLSLNKKTPPKLRNSLGVKTVIFLSSFFAPEKCWVSCVAKWVFSRCYNKGRRGDGFWRLAL